MIVWINGAAGSGKTTLARMLTEALEARGTRTVWLDGDSCRLWLTPDCDYSDDARITNLVRIWNVANLIHSVGGTVVCATVGCAPRDSATSRYVDFQIHLIGRERNPPWSGTTWPKPDSPDLVLNTGQKGIDECLKEILDLITS